MAGLLRDDRVLVHSMVIGELVCGNMRDRSRNLTVLQTLPRIPELSSDVVIATIEQRALMGRGIGFVDAHLVLSAAERKDTQFWTRDRRLHHVADELGVAFVEGDANG